MSCVNWNKADKGNVNQDNNAIESLLGSFKGDRPIYRETCGPSAIESLLEGLGVDQAQCGLLQPSDYYTAYLNDPKRGFPSSWTQPKNRYGEAYPRLIKDLYPLLKTRMVFAGVKALKDDLVKVLQAVDSVALVNLNDPGHYIAVLHIDEHMNVHYNDSWLGNPWGKAQTHKRSMHIDKFILNVDFFMELKK